MKNKFILCLISIGIIAALTGCGGSKNITVSISESEAIEEERPAEDLQESALKSESETSSETIESDSESEIEKHTDNEYYMSLLSESENISTEEMINVLVDEYEAKDKYSAFIFAGKKDDDMNTFVGKQWFVSDEEIKCLSETETEYYTSGETIAFTDANKKYFVIDEYYATQAVSYIYGVENGKVVETPISRVGDFAIIEGNDFSILYSEYDGSYSSEMDCMLGHTWKQYYFYYDAEKDEFKEYVGKLIDESKLAELCGFDMGKEIRDLGNMMSDIYYHDNGIVTANYIQYDRHEDGSYDIYYKQANYDINKKEYLDVWGSGENTMESSDFGGVYKAVLIPELMYSRDWNIDDIYDAFIAGEITDDQGRYSDYALTSPYYEDFFDLEWAKYDINKDGVRELIPRLYGSYTTCVYTVANGMIRTIDLYDSIFGSEGGYFNTNGQYVGTDCSHANRNQYIISEFNGVEFEPIVFFSKWWETEDDLSSYTYEKADGDVLGDEDLVKISAEEFDALCEQYIERDTSVDELFE